MIFSINYKQKAIGEIAMKEDGYDVRGISDKKHKKILNALLDIFYTKGVPGVTNVEHPNKDVITINDNINVFILEIGIKLRELGYSIQ